jgi:GAF domain-containing protein
MGQAGGAEGVLAVGTFPYRSSWRTARRRPPVLWVPGEGRSAVAQPVSVGAALSELAGLLLSTESFVELVQGVAELSVRVIDSVATCGITLSQDGRVMTVASTDVLARQLDEQQYERDSGPCLQALASGEVVEVVDMTVEDRWDGYPSVAVAHGILAVLSTPLIVDGKPNAAELTVW